MMFHIPAMSTYITKELVTGKGIYVDGTLGDGGHTACILEELKEKGDLHDSMLYGFDKDSDAIQRASRKLEAYKKNFKPIHAGFETAIDMLPNPKQVKAILLDLGTSFHQINSKERGFSYHREAKLDMRFSSKGPSAYDILNSYSMKDLQSILYKYGEEPRSKKISFLINKLRSKKKIETSGELAHIVDQCYQNPREAIKAKARVFQAIRIEVNHELSALKKILNDSEELLASKGRIAVISYHSLEDRIVKQFFKKLITDDWGPKTLPVKKPVREKTFIAITKKIVKPSREEIKTNRRCRSAKLRIIEKK